MTLRFTILKQLVTDKTTGRNDHITSNIPIQTEAIPKTVANPYRQKLGSGFPCQPPRAKLLKTVLCTKEKTSKLIEK